MRALTRSLPLVASTALVTALLTGCGLLPGDVDGTPRQRFNEAVAEVRSAVQREIDAAVEEARRQQEGSSGDIGAETRTGDGTTEGAEGAPRVDAIRTDTNTAFDYDEYTRTLETVLASLQEYWAQALPQLGVRYSAPERYVYYRPDQGAGPTCAGEQAPAKNAFYCPPEDFIAWDETGLMIPYYVQAGDFAAAFVLAHEFGHAMQARLPVQEPRGILAELQADCFAGAWSRYAQEQDLLSEGDLDEATLAVFSARDVPGTDFTNPQAHGSGFERTRAFTDGYEGGAEACYPAPDEEWLITRT